MNFLKKETYEGDYEEGLYHGEGKIRYSDGRIYKGSWVRGHKSGPGEMIYPDGAVFNGHWSADLRNGSGTFRFTSGDVYEGDYLNDKMDGDGKMTYADGAVYTGQWEQNIQVGFNPQDDQRIGLGHMLYTNGDEYEGSFLQGQRIGQGRMTYIDGSSYRGEWLKNEYHGHGVLTFPKDSKHSTYNGTFKGGKKHGTGTLVYSNGDVYEGQWSNDRKHGKGRIIHAAGGQIFEGLWDRGKKMGPGTYTFTNGDVFSGEWTEHGRSLMGTMAYHDGRVYRGEWKEGETHGVGHMAYPEGDAFYKGQWQKGKKCGHGKMRFSDGRQYEGEWKDDEPNGKGTMVYPLSDPATGTGGGTYEGDWVNGQRSGEGVRSYISGDSYKGSFKQDRKHGAGKWTYAPAAIRAANITAAITQSTETITSNMPTTDSGVGTPSNSGNKAIHRTRSMPTHHSQLHDSTPSVPSPGSGQKEVRPHGEASNTAQDRANHVKFSSSVRRCTSMPDRHRAKGHNSSEPLAKLYGDQTDDSVADPLNAPPSAPSHKHHSHSHGHTRNEGHKHTNHHHSDEAGGKAEDRNGHSRRVVSREASVASSQSAGSSRSPAFVSSSLSKSKTKTIEHSHSSGNGSSSRDRHDRHSHGNTDTNNKHHTDSRHTPLDRRHSADGSVRSGESSEHRNRRQEKKNTKHSDSGVDDDPIMTSVNSSTAIRDWLRTILPDKSSSARRDIETYFVKQEELLTVQDVVVAADMLLAENELQSKLRLLGVSMGCIVTVRKDIEARRTSAQK